MDPKPPADKPGLDAARLRPAAGDLRWLLGRGYPGDKALTLVGDRHGLDAAARQILRRGVRSPEVAQARRARLMASAELAGAVAGVDGHNLVITLEAALLGGPLVLADDGVLRDIAQQGRHHRPGEATRRALELMAQALAGLGAAGALVLWENPLPMSGELARESAELLTAAGVPAQARAVTAPHRELAQHPGPVATSYGPLLDQASRPVDLAACIIRGLEPLPLIVEL